MTRRQFIAKLKRLEACPDALAWIKRTKGTPAELWRKCQNNAWACWLQAHLPAIAASCVCEGPHARVMEYYPWKVIAKGLKNV